MSQQSCMGKPKNIQLCAWKPRRLSEDETTVGCSLLLSNILPHWNSNQHTDLTLVQCEMWTADGSSGPGRSRHERQVCVCVCMCETWQIKGRAVFVYGCQFKKRLINKELKVTSRIQSTSDVTAELSDTYKGRCGRTIICGTTTINHRAACQCQTHLTKWVKCYWSCPPWVSLALTLYQMELIGNIFSLWSWEMCLSGVTFLPWFSDSPQRLQSGCRTDCGSRVWGAGGWGGKVRHGSTFRGG